MLFLFRRKGWFQNNSSSEEKPVFHAHPDSSVAIQDLPEEPDVLINTVQVVLLMYDMIWYDMIWYILILCDIKFLVTHPQGSPDAVYAKPDKSAKKKLQEEENKKYANLSGRGNYLALMYVVFFSQKLSQPCVLFSALVLEVNSKENLNNASMSISPNYDNDVGNNSGFKEEIKVQNIAFYIYIIYIDEILGFILV